MLCSSCSYTGRLWSCPWRCWPACPAVALCSQFAFPCRAALSWCYLSFPSNSAHRFMAKMVKYIFFIIFPLLLFTSLFSYLLTYLSFNLFIFYCFLLRIPLCLSCLGISCFVFLALAKWFPVFPSLLSLPPGFLSLFTQYPPFSQCSFSLSNFLFAKCT